MKLIQLRKATLKEKKKVEYFFQNQSTTLYILDLTKDEDFKYKNVTSKTKKTIGVISNVAERYDITEMKAVVKGKFAYIKESDVDKLF